jgi:hypothetical protein
MALVLFWPLTDPPTHHGGPPGGGAGLAARPLDLNQSRLYIPACPPKMSSREISQPTQPRGRTFLATLSSLGPGGG